MYVVGVSLPMQQVHSSSICLARDCSGYPSPPLRGPVLLNTCACGAPGATSFVSHGLFDCIPHGTIILGFAESTFVSHPGTFTIIKSGTAIRTYPNTRRRRKFFKRYITCVSKIQKKKNQTVANRLIQSVINTLCTDDPIRYTGWSFAFSIISIIAARGFDLFISCMNAPMNLTLSLSALY